MTAAAAATVGNGGGSSTVPEEKKKNTTMSNNNAYEVVREVARSNAVVVFSNSGCCMCTVVKRLLFGLGVGPTIVEIDQIASSEEIQAVLSRLLGSSSSSNGGGGGGGVPAVFIGGKFLGGVETLMSCHINGSLVPLLKEAGALWL